MREGEGVKKQGYDSGSHKEQAFQLAAELEPPVGLVCGYDSWAMELAAHKVFPKLRLLCSPKTRQLVTHPAGGNLGSPGALPWAVGSKPDVDGYRDNTTLERKGNTDHQRGEDGREEAGSRQWQPSASCATELPYNYPQWPLQS